MYELNRRLSYSEVNADARMSYVSLLNYMQDCCTMESQDGNIGLDYLMQHNLGWVVGVYHLKIYDKMPFHGANISTRTYPYKLRGMFGCRMFEVIADGKTIAEADSMWVLMNTKELVPVKANEEIIASIPLEDVSERQVGFDLKRRKVSADTEHVYDFEVNPMQTDTNGHLNNAYYLQAAIRCHDMDENYKDKQIREMFISYTLSARDGDRIDVSACIEDNKRQVVLSDANASDDKVFASIELVY